MRIKAENLLLTLKKLEWLQPLCMFPEIHSRTLVLFIYCIYCVKKLYYNAEISFNPGPSYCSIVIFEFPVLHDL